VTTYLVDSGHGGAAAQGKSTANGLIGPRAGQRSRELAQSISRQFAQYGSAAAKVQSGEMAVLDPARHDPRTAA